MDNKIGPYQLGDSLGALPFGELVAATHTARRESLAFLILDERLAKDQRFRGLLRLEVARAGGVRHPALARPVEVGEQAGSLYIVIERPDDATVLSTLADDTWTPERVAALVQALAAGLDAAHDRRLAHGALGPSSVLVRSDGSPLLVGVGLLGAIEEAGLDAAVVEASDDAYTAPEQRSGPRAVASADGFALAALASSLLPSPSADARAVLDRQQAASPSDRFPTCAAFAAALAETLVSSATTAAITPQAAAPPPTHVPGFAPPSAMPAPTPGPAAPAPVPVTPSTTSSAPTVPAVPSAATPTTAPLPAEGVGLPWEETARADLAADVQEVAHEPLPWTPSAPASVRTVAVPESGTPGTADTPPLPWTPPPSMAVEDRIVTIPATPAVLACLGRLESKDPIGDGVHWVANRAPAVAELLDRVCVDGKVGPVPLGVAAAGLVALLLLVTSQLVPAMAVVGLVGVLYGIPLVTGRLSGEAARQEIVRVTGTARLSGRTDSILGGLPRLGLTNHLLLSLTPHAFDALARYAVPVRVDRPIPGTTGIRPATVAYDLPGVTVSYVAGNRLLLDVRAPTGVMLYRYPLYEGEPDDPPLAPDDGSTPPPAVTGPPTGHTFSTTAPSRSAVDRAIDNRLASASSADGGLIRLPVTPRLVNALQQAARAATKRAALMMGVPVLVAIGLVYAGSGFFAFMVLFVGFFFAAASPFARAFSLRRVGNDSSLVQATGPISVSSNRRGKTTTYKLHLFDGTEIDVGQSIFDRLSSEGQRPDSESTDSPFDSLFRSMRTSDRFDLPPVTTTYVEGGQLLLEVVNPSGAVLYRDPALSEDDLPRRPRTV
ncbi:MAG: hypothetical protein U0893_07580 [Chloroflexota bacterium]